MLSQLDDSNQAKALLYRQTREQMRELGAPLK